MLRAGVGVTALPLEAELIEVSTTPRDAIVPCKENPLSNKDVNVQL